MSRHGRCRCGYILKFRRGPQGYKTRCPQCQAVVRLRLRGDSGRDLLVSCPCGVKVAVFQGQAVVCPRCRRRLPRPLPGWLPPDHPAARTPREPTEELDAVEAGRLAVPLAELPATPGPVVSAAGNAPPSRYLPAVADRPLPAAPPVRAEVLELEPWVPEPADDIPEVLPAPTGAVWLWGVLIGILAFAAVAFGAVVWFLLL